MTRRIKLLGAGWPGTRHWDVVVKDFLVWASFVAVAAIAPARASVLLTDSLTTWQNDLGGAGFVTPTGSLGTPGTSVSNVSLNNGVSFSSSRPGTILQVGSAPNDWATWSGGYTGQVLSMGAIATQPVATAVTLKPTGTYAFGFEAEPNDFGTPINITVTLANGQTLTDAVNGNGGAQFFGYVGAGVASLTVSSPSQFAIGNFRTPNGAAIIANAVTPYVGNAIAGQLFGSPNPNGIAMFGTFTPNGGLTLSQAAAAMGYTGFDWQQTVTNWPDQNLMTSGGVLLTPVPVPDPPFLDPPPTGFSYSPCGSPSPAAAAANPFYFDPTGSASDCFSLAANEQGSSLYFGDEPMDHRLTPANVALGNIPEFTTDLVGILPGNTPGPNLFEWTWNSTYNGSTGGASRSANLPNQVPPDPCDTCTGHANIVSINGVPVPEPPMLYAFALGVLASLGLRRAIQQRPRYIITVGVDVPLERPPAPR